MSPSSAPLDKRSQFIPARKIDLFGALMEDLGFSPHEGDAARLYRLLTAILHFEFLGELERLHAAYHYLDPAQPGVQLPSVKAEAAYREFEQGLERVLKSANFVEISQEEMARAAKESGKIQYVVRNGCAEFRAVHLFRRGQHTEQFLRQKWFGLSKTIVPLEVYDEVVLMAAAKPRQADGTRKGKKPAARPGSVVIKLFHDIPSADLEALYPDVRVVMTLMDKLMLGVPALFGGIPLLIKLAPAFLVLYGLLRFYAGDPAAGGGDGISEALIVAGGVIALGGFLMQQWVKYERRALRYQKEVNDLIYFHNVTNNVGLFDHLIGVAEEQECKETLLAYFFLLVAPEPLSEEELDRRIESWLSRHFHLEVDFEVRDALDKLHRFGIVRAEGGRYSVLPLPHALRQLDHRWDNFFTFSQTEAA